MDVLSRGATVVREYAKQTQANGITRAHGTEGPVQMAVLERRVQRSRVVVEGEQEMVAGEDSARSRAALGPIEQRSMKIAAAAGDLEADWNLLAVNGGIPLPCAGDGSLGDSRRCEQE